MWDNYKRWVIHEMEMTEGDVREGKKKKKTEEIFETIIRKNSHSPN